jgi:sugar/nucleoside kinase (ribokinase family)
VKSLRARRNVLKPCQQEPVIIWEPIPDLCTPAELENVREASKYVNVISPNGSELADFFATGADHMDREQMVSALVAADGSGSNDKAVVVRDGADGCRLYIGGRVVHLPAFHQTAIAVVDPTGGGNTFLGGLAMAVSRSVDPSEEATAQALGLSASLPPIMRTMISASIHATIAASYAIEQVGMPQLDVSDGNWNGSVYRNRHRTYLEREAQYLRTQLDIHPDSDGQMHSGLKSD